MKINQKLILTLMICGLLGSPLALAKERVRYGGRMLGIRDSEIFEKLNLTEDQKKQLEANKQTQMGQVKALFGQMRVLSRQLNEELMKPQLDMAKVNDINAQMKVVQGQIADKRINSIIEVRKVLTPEQFSKFIAMTEEVRNKRREHYEGQK